MTKIITIIGVNYYPEDTAIGLYTSQLAEFFKNKGFEVNVVTGFPYYPSWEIKAEYKSKKTFFKENINGINILRYKQYVPKKPTFFKRVLHLLDFTFGTFFNILKIKKTDVVLCIVPFTATIFLGNILSKIKGAKLWVHIQDFEFDAFIDANISDKTKPKSLFFKILFWIEKKLLDKADILTTISTAMLMKLKTKISNSKKNKLLPNWVDVSFINPRTSKQHQYLNSNKFKILYSGNIGEKQDWDFFLLFANKIKEVKDVEIILVGNGSKRDWLKNKIKDFKNITFYDPVAYSQLSNLLCSADLHILFQKNNVIDAVMPSKILAMMASEKPSLITGNSKSEVCSIINKSNAGLYTDSKNFQEILNFIQNLKTNLELSSQYGKGAREYVDFNFSKDKVLKKFEKVLLDL